MESNGGVVAAAVTVTPSKSKDANQSKSPENVNPNVTSPNLKASNSPAIKSANKLQKSAMKKPNPICSPKNKIRERKFVVAKKNSKREKDKTLVSVECKCKAAGNTNRCLCVAYETLRASQEEFFKIRSEVAESNADLVTDVVVEMPGEKRKSIPEPGSGRVMSLIKAFENKLTLPKSDDEKGDEVEEVEDKSESDSKWELGSVSFSASDLLMTADNLRLRSRVSSSLDCKRERRSSGVRQSRRNSSESALTNGGSRWKRRAVRATSQQPFKLRTEQRGRSKQEEFMKKVKEMMIEQEKQRVPIAQRLPLTTDEPECLVKPPVKESTRPVDLVLHSDVRAVERAEFDHQVQEKLSFIEEYKLERERQQKLEEEEELRRLRKELVPKAQPMPYFDRPFIPRRSEKQPTIPKEPKFHNHPQHKKIKCCSMSWSDNNDLFCA
ncbi:microtubule-destabilizing protein 60-like isoform X2 [Rutidosis leptorrhynchoides]|uniref:microtubule-destabilizing protein 60-like isoform X2 n=1 Tax=Rutidosis leptorrhynchoides TaxID=125765 RepID=UPI003A9A4A07